jgi:uncharacterized membrane protein
MVRTSPLDKLTDTIFGFALAVGALGLTVRNPQDQSGIIAGIFIFGLSFVILIVIWWGHHDLMAHIDTSKPKTIFLNVVLLFFVAIEPYLLNTLNADLALFSFTSTLYAIDMAFLMGISAVLAHIVVAENHGKLSDTQLSRYRVSRNAQTVFAGLFLLSVFPQFLTWRFLNMPVRVCLWFATLILSIITSSKRRGNPD